jgi:hypothetical protein
MADLTVIAMSSATGGASRRNADFLAGRSRAAILPVLADMRSIAASGFLILRDAPDGSWLSRQFAAVGMSESIPRNLCSGVRQRMERAENGESVTGAGGSVPSQLERRAKPAESLSERMVRLGDAGHNAVSRPWRSLAASETKKANRKCNDGSPHEE